MIASILINSKNPKNLEKVFNSYVSKASDKSSFEIIVNINSDDHKTKNFLESQIKKKFFKLKYISSYEGDYFSGHINNNNMLKEVSDESYFISCTGDRVLNTTKFWDDELRKYINYFDDQFFRIKCSSHKHRKYFDYWECCFAPSNITFTTQKLIKINNDLSPCFSHDAFQQCVFYYLEKHDNFNANQINRDIISNNLSFVGDTPEEKSEEDLYRRINGQLKVWDILTSAKIQKEAFKRAMIIKANIIFFKDIDNFDIFDTGTKICIKNKSSGVVTKYSYSVNRIIILINNFFRKLSYLNYCGAGFKEDSQPHIFSIFWYLDFRYRFFRGIKDVYNKYFS